MSAARFARSAPRFAAQLRAPTQRRFASGAAQNEFIAERQHIKEHAKESTGAFASQGGVNWCHQSGS